MQIKTKFSKPLFLVLINIITFTSIFSQVVAPSWWDNIEPCTQVDPCNIISNGSPLDDANIYLSAITENPIDNICTQNIDEDLVVHCWFPLSGQPGVPMNLPPGSTCTSPTFPNQMLNEFSLGAANNGHVATLGQLSTFNVGHTYNMYFKIRTTGSIDNFFIKLGNSSGVIFPATQSYGGWLESEVTVASNETVYTLTNINNPAFTYYCLSFTPTANYDMIYLFPKMNLSSPLDAEMLYITDIHLFDLTTAAFPQNSYTISCLQNTLQLGNPDCTLPAGGTWSWTPATYITGANTATPVVGPIINTSGVPINYPVTATYTLPGSVGGCAASVTQNITVYPNPALINIIGNNTYCTEGQMSFSTSFPNCPNCEYSWYISSGGSTL